MYRLRFDIKNDLNSDDILEVCQPTSHVVVRHELPHGNPHFHLWIETDIKQNALRQRIKRKFEYLLSTDYSLKSCNPNRLDEYIQYMFNTKHGNKWELIDLKNFDEVKLKQLQVQAKTISDDFQLSKKDKKSDRPTIWQLATEVSEQLQYTRRDINYDERFKQALQECIKVCLKYKQPFEFHYLKRLATTAISIHPLSRYDVVQHIMNKEFNNYKLD